tara:strand:- start:2080 stop:2526 length:447 start_codon:yes stop_codon:yes gene_type:complete
MAKTTRDYANPGLNEQGGKDLNFIVENSEFLKIKSDDGNLDRSDIFRIAVGVAISRDLNVPDSVGTTGSSTERPNGRSWTQRTLDKPSTMKTDSIPVSLEEMVSMLCDHESAKTETWGYIERLAHAGLKELREDIKSKKLLSETLECA